MRIKPHSSGYGSAVGTAARTLQRVGDSEWVERLGRIGLVAKGVSFAIVGVLALLVAFGAGGAATDRPGAFRYLSDQSYGFVALLAIALGFGAYALWRFAQALLNRDDEGNDMEGWAKRAGALAKGLFYGGLSLLAISFLTGPRGESESERERTAQVFEWPLGRWLVGALGVALVAYGLWNGYRSISGKFRKHLEEGKIHREKVSPLVNVAGFLGHAARMVLFGMVGVFLIRAAYQYDPKEAIGLDEALAKLAHQPGGPIWLGAAAVGLFAYGAFSLLQARYRDI
jgi:drug/metabolite transporter (DMT)-like permease